MVKQSGACKRHPECGKRVCRIRYANGSKDSRCERCRKPIRWQPDLCVHCRLEAH